MHHLFAQSAQELMRSGNRSLSQSELIAMVVSLAAGLLLAYGSYTTWKRGLKLSETTTIHGTPAKLLSGVLACLAVAVTLYGVYSLMQSR